MFGAFLEHDLAESFPLLTTKKVFFRGVLEELAWFLRGSTNNQELIDRGVQVFGNKNAEQYDPITKVDCGAIYGFNWRHFGATYVDCHTDYTDQGVDQIASIIREIQDSQLTPTRSLCVEPLQPACLPPVSRAVPVLCRRRWTALRANVSTQRGSFLGRSIQPCIDSIADSSHCPRVQSRGWHSAHHHRRRAHLYTARRSGA